MMEKCKITVFSTCYLQDNASMQVCNYNKPCRFVGVLFLPLLLPLPLPANSIVSYHRKEDGGLAQLFFFELSQLNEKIDVRFDDWSFVFY